MSPKRVVSFAEFGLFAALGLSSLSPPSARSFLPATATVPSPTSATRPAIAAPGPVQRALGFSWGSFVETGFDSRRLAKGHTISLRFMAAYEGASRGVLLADGTGNYRLGLAPYASLGSPALEVAVGGATFTSPLPDPVLTDNDFRKGVPQQRPRRWRQLTITRKQDQIGVYLQGARVGGFAAGGQPIAGTLRFGRLAQPGEVQDQFYGLIDEVAIFAHALEATEVRALARRPQLEGNEPGLIARWSFDDGPSAPGPFEPPFSLRGSAELCAVSAARLDAPDSAALPAPRHQTRFTLPFAEGEVWLLIQGVNSSLSHNDDAAFAFDFLRVDPSLAANNPSGLPGGSHEASDGARLVAAADGQVVARVDCFPNDDRSACPAAAYPDPPPAFVAGAPANRNLLCLEHGAGEVSCALHLQNASIRAAQAERVPRGQELAEVGRTGARSVHLHFAVSDLPEPNTPGSFAPLVTFPVAFSDYEVSTDFGGHWRRVARGVPSPGEWLRRAPLGPNR